MSGIYQDMYEEERAIAQEQAEDHARELAREFPSDTPLEALYNTAHELELSLSSYSGRGMYGRLCPSISGPNALAIVEEAASRGVRGARIESLGLGSVVYWPALEWDEAYATRNEEESD